MNHLSLYVTLFVLVFSQTNARHIIRSPSFVCPVEDIIETQCLGPKDCLYPNPEDCGTFIQCTVDAGGQSGTPVVMPCPDGLEWNDNKKICDWPEESICQQGITVTESIEVETKTELTTTEVPTTETSTTTEEISVPECKFEDKTRCSPSTTTEAPTTTEEMVECTGPDTTTNGPVSETTTTSAVFVCPVEDIIETQCLGPKDCLYVNPDDCRSFIQCKVNAGEQSGIPVLMPCPAGLEWNDKDKICDWPENSTCPKAPVSSIIQNNYPKVL